jgi:hypothetical protein
MTMNLKRRHLNETQRATVAAKLANMQPKDTLKKGSRSANLPNGEITQPEAAAMLNVSERKPAEVTGNLSTIVDILPATERRAGEMLADMEKQAGARGVGKKVELQAVTTLPPKLADLLELAQRLADGMGCGAVVIDLEGEDD